MPGSGWVCSERPAHTHAHTTPCTAKLVAHLFTGAGQPEVGVEVTAGNVYVGAD